jgi:tellurite resistance protein
MTEAPIDAGDSDDDAAPAAVERDRAELREFIKELNPNDVKSGDWFSKLVAHALNSYTNKVDWQYFQEKYKGVPADGIVEQRITMASRYAALEGGLSAGAYSAAVAATIGSAGGASPLTLPAAAVTLMVDLTYITQLQLRLAYDISVLYRIPLDLDDPDDMWKLIRVAFTIKGGELAREGVTKSVPLVLRPLVKQFYSKNVLVAAKGLPVVGKHLLQRNVIKVGIPLVGIPLTVVLNRYTTLVAGRHARAVFRNEARVIELAERLSSPSRYPQLMLWVAWLVITADNKIGDDETLLMKHLVRVVRDQHQVVDNQLANVVDIDPSDVWKRLDAESGDLTELLDVADRVATVDGDITAREKEIIAELHSRCRRA